MIGLLQQLNTFLRGKIPAASTSSTLLFTKDDKPVAAE